MSDNQLPEFIPEEMEAAQLYKLGCRLSNEVARLSKVVAGYEVGFKSAERAYKKQWLKRL